MGLRFRKSIKVGKNTRINLSKSGVGFSVGTKDARVTKKAGGGTRTTLSVPGTGISYVKDSKQKPEHTPRSTNANKEININTNGPGEPKKRKTWLWVLGWICIFPLPLTILLLRKKEMNAPIKYGIIVAAWLIYLLIAISGGSGTQGNDNEVTKNSTMGKTDPEKTTSENTITEIVFSNNEDVELKVGESVSGQVTVNAKKKSESLLDAIELISENTDVVTITRLKTSPSARMDYRIDAIGAGETKIYATSKDGSVCSEKIDVRVSSPVMVESIAIEGVKETLILGEKVQAVARVLPENAENQTVTWTSSDENVVTIDSDGLIVAVGGGSSTISATSENNVIGSADILVDGTKRKMSLRVSSPRQDENNIGDEWSWVTELNGEPTVPEYELSAGDTIECYARFTEEDENPDIGEASTSYTVTEEDLMNGFTISMDLYVTENGGRNSGESAYYIVKYSFMAQ